MEQVIPKSLPAVGWISEHSTQVIGPDEKAKAKMKIISAASAAMPAPVWIKNATASIDAAITVYPQIIIGLRPSFSTNKMATDVASILHTAMVMIPAAAAKSEVNPAFFISSGP